MAMKQSDIDRFWSKVDKTSDPNGCWVWTAYKDPNGYGRFYHGKLCHRISYEINVGPIDKGLCICHHCDNPGCVNPDHLFVGTHQDNMDDKKRKGRQAILNAELNGFYGKTHTDEMKQHLSQVRKGRIPWNKGRIYSDEERQKMKKVWLKRKSNSI